MKMKLLSSVLVVCSVSWAWEQAQAQPAPAYGFDSGAAGGWCDNLDRATIKPECGGGLGPTALNAFGITQARWNSPCTGSPNIEVTYPVLGAGQTKMPPLLLLHGGGMAAAYTDVHGHPANPFQELATRLAQRGFFVIQPILNIGSGSLPYQDADNAQLALTCAGKKTNSGECGASPLPSCETSAVDRVSWGANFGQNLILVGYSAGAIASMYLPEKISAGVSTEVVVRALIMIDPAKQEYTQNPPSALNSQTPVVHIYPDYYGPLKNNENKLFRMGAPASCVGGTDAGLGCDPDPLLPNQCTGGTCTGPKRGFLGPWVPIGLRSTVFWAGGTYDTHHCTGLERGNSYQFPNPNPDNHYPYTTGCGTASQCGQDLRCQNNTTINTFGHYWFSGTARHILRRYVVAHAACRGADYGVYNQSWVTGMDRQLDDSGALGGYCVPGLPPYGGGGGPFDPVCANNTTPVSCWNAHCHWAQNEEQYPFIRINNGSDVTNYQNDTTVRFYGAYEGWNGTTGVFKERKERLGLNVGDTNFVECQAGIANF